MNLLKFLLSFCFIILCSCADYKIKEAKPKKEKKFYSSYGFALIYDESLYNNDLLVTGDDGFVMFAYLDDGSLIKVHKNSGVYVNGDILNNSIFN